MDDLLIESRNKYGKSDDWGDAADDMACALGGTKPRGRDGGAAVVPHEDDGEMDALALIQRAYSPDRYGRG